MSQVMMIGILIAAYIVYIFAGNHYQFPIGWIDWNSPYLHYAVADSGSFTQFVVPGLALAWCGYVWYQKSMTGEA